MQVYLWEHIVRTAEWMLTKLARDEVLMVHHQCCCCFRPDPSRADPGRGKNRSQGSPYSTNLLFRLEGYSNKPNA